MGGVLHGRTGTGLAEAVATWSERLRELAEAQPALTHPVMVAASEQLDRVIVAWYRFKSSAGTTRTDGLSGPEKAEDA